MRILEGYQNVSFWHDWPKYQNVSFFGAQKPKCKLFLSGYENVSKISVEDENVLVHEIIFPLFILSISGATKRRIFGFKCSTMFAFFNIEMFDVRMFAISATKILGFLLFGCDIFHIAENVQKIPYLSKVFCDIDKYRNQRAKKTNE